jgi:hypothetical protein
MAKAQSQKLDYRESPVAWFCVLETARNEGDFARAATAQRELRRLGVEIRYRRARSSGRRT